MPDGAATSRGYSSWPVVQLLSVFVFPPLEMPALRWKAFDYTHIGGNGETETIYII